MFVHLIGTELEDKFTTGFGIDCANATDFPSLMNKSTLAVGISSDTLRIHETVWPPSNDSTTISIQSFVRTEFHIQDWADLRI